MSQALKYLRAGCFNCRTNGCCKYRMFIYINQTGGVNFAILIFVDFYTCNVVLRKGIVVEWHFSGIFPEISGTGWRIAEYPLSLR